MDSLEKIIARIVDAVPGAQVELFSNPGPAAQHGLVLGAATAREVAVFLRDDPELRFDYCSNVTGVDWPEREIVETVRTPAPAPDGGPPRVVDQRITRRRPGCLEAVYHLYSIARRQGPLVLRLRTENRTDRVALPSLTPVWRSCELQEREIFDLFGIEFTDHPDLRRILMWDAFADHPMRKDYVPPADDEWEPTSAASPLRRKEGA